MSAVNMGRSAGLAFGVAIGLVIAVIVIRLINKDRKLRTDYDEMQKIIRGDAYRIAFYTIVCCEAALYLATLFCGELPVDPMILHFLPIFAGITVQASCCIWKGAYVGQNTNLGRFIAFAFFISLFNLGLAALAWAHGNMVVDGILQTPFTNFLCGLIFAVLGVVALVRKLTERGEEE